MDRRLRSKNVAAKNKRKAAGSDPSPNRGSEEAQATPITRRGQRRWGDQEPKQEEEYSLRPELHINVPDHLKALLIDDWENVTSKKSLVPLPSEHPVNEILTTYFEEEKHKYRLGSAEAELFLDASTGCQDYFENCVDRLLLYRFERQQYAEVRKLWMEGKGEWEGKNAGDLYGAEHQGRLLVAIP